LEYRRGHESGDSDTHHRGGGRVFQHERHAKRRKIAGAAKARLPASGREIVQAFRQFLSRSTSLLNQPPRYQHQHQPAKPPPAVSFCILLFDQRQSISRYCAPSSINACPVGVEQRDQRWENTLRRNWTANDLNTTKKKKTAQVHKYHQRSCSITNHYHDLSRAYDHEFTTLNTCAIGVTLGV